MYTYILNMRGKRKKEKEKREKWEIFYLRGKKEIFL
jgi:hypothetical protein